MAGWGGDPVLGEIGDDDLLRGRVLCDEAGVMEGEDGVKRAVATALDAAFSSLLHDVGIVPAEVGGDTSDSLNAARSSCRRPGKVDGM